jgi:hypothetical protein
MNAGRIVPTLAALGAACVTAAAQAPPADPAALQAQRDAMARLAWLAGEWRGEATMQRGPQAMRSLSWEQVTPAADGLALLVRGRHHKPDADGKPGDVVHDAAGMITFDPASGRYRFVTQLATGQQGSFDATVEGGRFKWFLPAGPATVRYEIFSNPAQQWMEEGYYCPTPGAECARFFSMQLVRQ